MSFLNDLRYALRQLWRSPAFAIAAVLSLALGIAAATAVFSVIYSVLVNPYPYKAADRIVKISTQDKGGNLTGVLLTGSQFEQIGQAKSVESAVAWQNWDLPLTGSGLPEDVRAEFLTANASAYFGVGPLLGRGLLPSDAPPGGDAQMVPVLSYSFWRRHFDASPEVLGKTLQLLRKNYTIVGVLPPRFTWNDADVYLPLKIGYDPHSVLGFAVRLKPGVSLQAADAEFQGLFEQFAKENLARFPGIFRVRGQRLNDRYGESLEHTLYLLFGAVALLLLIGCANVSILLLARGHRRKPLSHDTAVADGIVGAVVERNISWRIVGLRIAWADREMAALFLLSSRSGDSNQSSGAHLQRWGCARDFDSFWAFARSPTQPV
jgi:MacB-like periplasmic core domain